MKWVVALVALGLAGCVSTSEMQLAPNVYRLETNAQGALFVGQSGNQTLKRAAELTLKNGYTHFKLEDAGFGTGSQVVGVAPGTTYSNASVSGSAYGNTFSGYGSGTSYTTPATVIRAPTEKSSATVVMFKSGDPQAVGAFDAEAVLKAQGS